MRLPPKTIYCSDKFSVTWTHCLISNFQSFCQVFWQHFYGCIIFSWEKCNNIIHTGLTGGYTKHAVFSSVHDWHWKIKRTSSSEPCPHVGQLKSSCSPPTNHCFLFFNPHALNLNLAIVSLNFLFLRTTKYFSVSNMFLKEWNQLYLSLFSISECQFCL